MKLAQNNIASHYAINIDIKDNNEITPNNITKLIEKSNIQVIRKYLKN